MWPKLDQVFLKPFPKLGGDSVLPSDCKTEDEAWKKCIDSIMAIRELEADWDGQGTEAPTPEVVDSALILAIMLRERKVRPPSWTVQGVRGDISLEWQWRDQTTLDLDILEPYGATLTLLPTGGQGQQWVVRETVSV